MLLLWLQLLNCPSNMDLSPVGFLQIQECTEITKKQLISNYFLLIFFNYLIWLYYIIYCITISQHSFIHLCYLLLFISFTLIIPYPTPSYLRIASVFFPRYCYCSHYHTSNDSNIGKTTSTTSSAIRWGKRRLPTLPKRPILFIAIYIFDENGEW